MDELIKAINSSNKYNPKIIKSLVSIIQNEKPSLSLFLKSLMNLGNEIYFIEEHPNYHLYLHLPLRV